MSTGPGRNDVLRSGWYSLRWYALAALVVVLDQVTNLGILENVRRVCQLRQKFRWYK